jgi:hypothetical protein
MNMEDLLMRKDVVNEEAAERGVEVLEFNKIKVSVFDFKKDWALVEPHLNDPEVLELLNEGMLAFSQDYGWKHLPLWDPNNDIGPWEYARGDGHATYALDKVNEDPETQALYKKYEMICSNDGFEFDELMYEDINPKMKKASEAYAEEFGKIMDKYLPKKNTYRWYQCFCAGCYLQFWHLALAEKVFPDFEWDIFEKDNPDSGKCSITNIGKGPNRKYLIFDIFLFDSCSADEILENVGLNQNSMEKAWEAKKQYWRDLLHHSLN